MLKQTLSIVFTIFFMSTIIVPSVIVFVDDSIDISFVLDASEEEEEKEKDKNKELEVYVNNTFLDSDRLFSLETDHNLFFTFKKYPKPHLNLIFPPPECIG